MAGDDSGQRKLVFLPKESDPKAYEAARQRSEQLDAERRLRNVSAAAERAAAKEAKVAAASERTRVLNRERTACK